MLNILSEYKNFWSPKNKRSFSLGVLLLLVSLYVQAMASNYSIRTATRFVGDIFLDNLPTINLTPLIVEGSFLVVVFSALLFLWKPRYLLFGLKVVAIFILVRSFFITLTHLGVYPNTIVLGNDFFDRIYSFLDLEGGYFFSGHTGLPILMAIIFWNDKLWRWFFIFVSVIMAAAVLLAHIHYSIDVFAAPFMSYGIFKITEKLFPEDYHLLQKGLIG